ncbi:sialate O-acetylesterase [Pedobacter sp. UYEF25]
MNLLISFIAIFSHVLNPVLTNKGEGLKVNRLFADHMVLQQKDQVAIWGKANAGSSVSVDASWGKKISAITTANGEWKLKISTPKAGGPYQIDIRSGEQLITIKDVLIGEVWLASGQSNMDLPLSGWGSIDTIMNGKEAIASANFPKIRFLKVSFGVSATPLDSMGGNWTPLSPKNVGEFSAAAYFYAIKLQKKLNVPIGIIQSSIGGTPAEAWTSAENLKKLGDFNDQIDGLQSLQINRNTWLKKWKTYNKPNTDATWKLLAANEIDASKVNLDDSKWNTTSFPGRYDRLKKGEFDGCMWIRKEFEVKDLSVDYELRLGGVDDMDITYINGKELGAMLGSNAANAPRDYAVPKNLLHIGKNLVCIWLTDTGGPGSISGEMNLTSKNGVVIHLEGDWKSRLVDELIDGKYFNYGIKSELSQRPNLFELNSNTPTVLFNAMINPIIPYSIKGVIWYQGESNVGRAKQYEKLFPLMIEDWRVRWGEILPFYYVQLAPYNYTDPSQKEQGQKIRNAQRLALRLPKTGMVTTLDIGRLISAHPTQKKEIGDRLARFALSNEYGQHMVTSGPLFKNVIINGNQLIVSFEKASIGGGLVAKNGKLADFEIAGSNKVFVSAHAIIKGNLLIVSVPSVKSPIYVRYAWSDGAFGSLFNKEGLPAATFTSEK